MIDHIGSEPVVLTHGGRYVSLTDPEPNTIDIEDIAHALSHICRYTGHTDRHYSVAEHSLRCAGYLRRRGYTPFSQLAALLHDATEAYLGDVSSPLKSLLPEYRELEERMEAIIELTFGVKIHGRPEVKMADLQLLASEREQLMTGDKTPWAIVSGLDPNDYIIRDEPAYQNPELTKRTFLMVYNKLRAEIAGLKPDRH